MWSNFLHRVMMGNTKVWVALFQAAQAHREITDPYAQAHALSS